MKRIWFIWASLASLGLSLSAQDSISPQHKTLKTVQVIGYKQILRGKGNLMIYSLKPNTYDASSTADQAMRYLPGVESKSGGFQLQGSDKPASIQINGVTVSQQELKNLLAKDIKEIEIRTSGADGEVINIIKKKVTVRKYNGVLSLGGGAPGIIQGGGNIGYQSPVWDLSLSFYPSRNEQDNDVSGDIRVADRNRSYEISASNKFFQETGNVRLTYSPNSKWVTSLSGGVFAMSSRIDFEDVFVGEQSSERRKKAEEYQANVSLISLLKMGKQNLRFRSLYYYTSKSDKNLDNPAYIYGSQLHSYTADLLYEKNSIKTFGGEHNLWIKAGYSLDDSHLGESLGRSQDEIYRLSAGDNLYFGKSWTLSLAPQINHVRRSGKHIDRKEWEFTPQAILSVRHKGVRYSFTYMRSVIRPFGFYLSPQVEEGNRIVQVQGNPDLKNSYMDSYILRLGKQIKSSYLSLSFAHREVSDEIASVYTDTKNYVKTYLNAGHSRLDKLSLGLFGDFAKSKVSVNLNGGIGYIDSRLAGSVPLVNGSWIYDATLILGYRPKATWFFEGYIHWNGRNTDMMRTMDTTPTLDLTASKMLLNNRLNVRLSVSPFRIRRDSYERFEDGFSQIHSVNKGQQYVKLTLKWNFGKYFQAKTAGNAISRDDMNLGSRI